MRSKVLLLAALVLATAAMLALPVGGASKVTSAKLDKKTLTLTGSDGDDTVTVDVVPGLANPNKDFYEIHDPDGVDEIPAGCFRKDANTIRCPVELVRELEIDLLAGNDEVTFGENVELDGDVDGGGGADDLVGADGNDYLTGGAGGDHFSGKAGKDRASGGRGRDRESGGAGNDTLKGGPKADRLKGGPGVDVLNGGGGRDRCNGGAGHDTPISCEIGYAY
jgi:Ca2+-binding RTX toxin-like protein